MGKLASLTFIGASGTSYSFETYSLDSTFQNVGAVYIFTERTPIEKRDQNHREVYIGQTNELKDRIENHDKWDCLEFNGVNCICIHIDGDEASRLGKEADLIRHYKTPCNKQ